MNITLEVAQLQIKRGLLLNKMNTKDLCFLIEKVTAKADARGDNALEIATVRGWILDELEKRDQLAFGMWMESEEDLPRKFFTAQMRKESV